jgi:hypothetical protein
LLLDPWFITGFTDGDGCLGINIYKENAYKLVAGLSGASCCGA